MEQKFRTGASPDQGWLMPPDPRDWLPAGHLTWKVIEQAGEMDLSGFGACYRADGQGGRPYHPAMMITLVLYCYCRGRRSSREMEMATWDDVGARVICGGLHPDHSTIAEFIGRHFEAVCGLLPESVKACAREGLVCLDLVAGDGTKLKANASMASNRTAEQLDAEIAELGEQIDAEFRQWARDMLDDEDGPDGPDDDGAPDDPGDAAPDVPACGDAAAEPAGGGGKKKEKKKPKRPGHVLAARRAARAELEARQDGDRDKLAGRAAELAARLEQKEAAVTKWEQKAAARIEERARSEAAGQKISGTRPITGTGQDREVKRARQARDKARAAYQAAAAEAAGPPAGLKGKVSATDPASRVMPLKKGGFDQLINVQALATARTQVILAILRHDSPADVQALVPLMKEAARVLAAAGIPGEILNALFDAGYASDANFTDDSITARLYVAVTREARQTGRSADGRAPRATLPSWEEMTSRLSTPEGKALCKQRSATIEPVFAQLTARLSRTLRYRGRYIDAELALWAATHNILKAITARDRRLSRQARTTATAAPLLAAA
jgi:transposase